MTIEEKPSMTFYASKFNGHMFSHQNWEEKYQNLKTILLADDNANPDTTNRSVSDTDKKTIVDVHNKYRGGVEPPATDMYKMVSDQMACI